MTALWHIRFKSGLVVLSWTAQDEIVVSVFSAVIHRLLRLCASL